ncbi:uncharacterized protein [Nicotiana sylvestris]|uniref:uncharacterized protein n=1 Tax=Nicotiana sylvestris TaxID=4096 RepID=UPI00388CC9E7
MVLQQQYREKGFKKYSELISLLLVAEQNNDLLMRNHENRPTGSTPLPEVDEVYSHYAKRGKGRGLIRGRGHGRGRGQGRNFPNVDHPPPQRKITAKSGKGKMRNQRQMVQKPNVIIAVEKAIGHIFIVPRHLVELYQASLKNKGPEANFVSDNNFDITHLDVADFFERSDGKIDHLIGDGSMVKDD